MNAPIKPPEEFAEAKRFLLALSPNGPWVLTTIHPTARGTDTMFCETIEQAMKFVAENNGKRNIYFTAQAVQPVSSKPSLSDATLYEYASVDIDKNEEGVRLSAETKVQAIANLRSNKFCKDLGIPGVPTFLLDSGNGLQALWRFAIPLKPTEENTHSMKEINAFLIKVLHGDKGTHNPIQLMRLPGTTNLPSASKRKAGLVECHAAVIMATEKAYKPSTFLREPVLHILEGRQIIGSGEMIESLDALKKWRLSDSLLRIIEFGRDDQWQGKVSDDTDSGWQFRGIKMLIERGVTDTIIKGLITDPRWGISRSTFKGRNRTVDDYADRQIVRAHAALVEERKSRFPDDGIEEQYEKLMDEKEDDIFAPLFEITADTRGELYNAKGEPRLLAKLKVQDRRRFEQLWTQFQNRRVRDLIGLGREVNKIIKAAGKRQAKKKSTEPNDFLRDSNGFPKPTQENIRLAIEKLGVTLVHNDFSSKPSIDGLGEKFDGLLQDHAIAELWLRIDAEFSFRPRMDFFTTVVINVCRRNAFHPVKDYLDSLVWDSKPRIETWLIDYCHAEDTPFNRAVGRMFLIAAVRRIKRPGEKFDTMLILEGPEGNNKSGVFRTLAKKPGWFSDSIRFTDDDKQIIEKAAGKWILEIADMQGLTKADFDRVKALLSRQSDNARAAYARLASEVHRQFVIGATTNLDSYLASLTGNRRNWCVRTPHWIELDILNGAVDQLWAEAVAQEIDEPDLFLPRELWDEAKIVQAEREIENPFADRIDELVGSDEGYVFALDMIEALSIPLERAGPREYLKLAHAMSKLGFEKKQRARNKRRMTCYERISPGTVPKMFRFRFDQDERRWIRAASWESKSGEADDFDLDELDEPVEADEPDED